ncbi:D-amino acid dehydrogenase small subunit [Bergeriella denitrificans]|uniref:D-amino acid dehydrogenase small subunit n=2 Tax=Bergeriella denitrificans TaxID=494 RepID=A0A378UDI3_BERDE|nr:FAD-binding oxidoreductase [Bergeriella denitrificans]STZ75464.1 D-amino acid dehydrogenase small subunit [Bergeriella denitrificans]
MSGAESGVIVIGAGIVGISCALHLQKSGYRVTVIDPRGVAGGASHGNAGLVVTGECVPLSTPEMVKALPKLLLDKNSPLQMDWAYAPKMTGWFYRFLKAGTLRQVEHASASLSALLEKAAAAHYELAGWAGCRGNIARTGWLKLFERDDTYRAARIDFDRMERFGVRCDYMDAAAIQAAQPNLAPVFKHAVNHPDSLQIVNPGEYVKALGSLFMLRGGRLVQAEITGLERKNHLITAALSQTERYEADAFVVAAGAWSKKLSADTGTFVPLDTERGYHIEIDVAAEHTVSEPLFWGEHSVVMSPGGGKLRITSSVEFAGLHKVPDFRKLAAKRDEFQRIHRHPLGKIRAEWLGFRPSVPDSIPVIGRANRADNAFLAFGHGHVGLTLGPVTGRIIADLVAGRTPEIDTAPYSPSRFLK